MSENKSVVEVTPEQVSDKMYDVVIVGSGVAGAIAAKQLCEEGKSVLIIEAGTSGPLTGEFSDYLENFLIAVNKHPNSPYPLNLNALSPSDGLNGYFEEQGPLPISGSYTRITGGTTSHWEGKTLRMLPDDFELKTKYGTGLDWPIGYEKLQPYYCKAEKEIGVAGDVEEQKELGIPFDQNYKFPMGKIPPSYLDKKVGEKINGNQVEWDGKSIELKLSTFPQGRTSEAPPGAYGSQCQGGASCVPICRFRARYDATKTLNAISSSNPVHLLPQAVASEVEIEQASGRVTAIRYKHYQDKNSPEHSVATAKGKIFVLAANAVENARLMLASNLPNTSGLIGCNLMDHPFILTWSLMPEEVGTMRGPLVTSGIGTFRKGDFRNKLSAFGIDIHNDGWGWAGISVTDIVRNAVDKNNKYGKALQEELKRRISRQLLLAFMFELPAEQNNRVLIDYRYKDNLGNYRPVINFNLPDYCKESMVHARNLSREIFKKLGAEDHTYYDKCDRSYFEYKGEGYWFRGGNHFSGTHIMGTDKHNSVVNDQLRSWDHENLYLLGSGNMPSIGTSNTTLTIAALSFRASEEILKVLQKR